MTGAPGPAERAGKFVVAWTADFFDAAGTPKYPDIGRSVLEAAGTRRATRDGRTAPRDRRGSTGRHAGGDRAYSDGNARKHLAGGRFAGDRPLWRGL